MNRQPFAAIEVLLIDGNNLLHRLAGSADPAALRGLLPRLTAAIPGDIATTVMLDGYSAPGSGRSQRVRRRYKATLNGTLCFTIDVGRVGFCVELLRAMEPGTEVRGTFDARGIEVPYRGRIRWAQAGAPYLGVRARMGVLFAQEP
jgi:hypothetical protein